MKEKLKNLSIAIRLLILGVVIFSLAYSGIIGIIGQTLWTNSADGSLIRQEGEIIGSQLIGQKFENPKLFHGRPSSINYNATQSGSQNLAPNNPILTDRVKKTLNKISENRTIDNLTVPPDLVTESGSALDPHITTRSALFQIPRISKNTGIPEDKLRTIVEKYSQDKLLGLYGIQRVNILELNLEIKKIIE
ncbi:hypothetical protein AKJ66_02270, partial [candidate division MSBL1 archaeon SCGC-AAA259E22]